ncbi:WD40 repeat-like protein, partial [Hysterangium stoloniferum]
YFRKLNGHTSCINALTWSRNGRWLASSGDDKCVLIWDFHPVDVLSSPFIFHGPRANVLSLAFTASCNTLLSGDVNGTVLQYDVSRMPRTPPLGAERLARGDFAQGEDEGIIRGITSHPRTDYLCLTASEQGRVILHDTRVPQNCRGVGILTLNAVVTGVQFHPVLDHLFVISDERGRCSLRDIRTAFTNGSSSNPEPPGLVNYVTKVAKSGQSTLSNPEAASIVFDSTGTKLAVTMQHFLPTIYTVWDEWPLAICSGSDHPSVSTDTYETQASPSWSGRSYVNACTIKHGSFWSPDFQTECYYGAGSDDFLGYVWKVPNEAVNCRKEVSFSDWGTELHNQTLGMSLSLTPPRIFLTCLTVASTQGHKSIVNTVLFHPLEPYVVTAGVERYAVLHSPFQSTVACGKLKKTEASVRKPLDNTSHRALARETPDAGRIAGIDDDDLSVIRFFDNLILSEGMPDVFDTRRWSGSDSDSDPKEDSSSGEADS